jgi:DHA2 family multidrug resistance protein
MTTSAAPATFEDPFASVSVARRWWIMVAVVLGSTIYNATVLIASGLQPQMQGAMSATQDEIAWTVTFNILATAVVTPMTGWLVARFGTRRVLVGSTGLFTLGTVGCGLAGSLESLVLWRIVQGGGGAPLVPLGNVLLLNVFPLRQHGLAMSVFGVTNMAGPIIGPVFGGYIAEEYSWRWVFFLTVPVCLAALVAFQLSVPTERNRERIRLDWTGFVALSIALGLAQIVFARGQRLDWFQSHEIVALTAIALMSLYVFIAHSATASRPFLSPRLVNDRNYVLGMFLVTIFGMLNLTPMVLLPQLLQGQAGYPDTLIGYVVSWRGAGAILGFFLSNWIGRWDPRIGMIGGFGTQAISGYWLSTIDLNVTADVLAANGFLQGFAIGIIWVPMTLAAFRTLPNELRPEAMSVFHLMRNIGSSVFISISVAHIISATGANYSRMAEMITPFNRMLELPWVMGSWSIATLPGLAGVAREINRQSALIGYLNAFTLYMIASLVAIPAALLLGYLSTRSKTGLAR